MKKKLFFLIDLYLKNIKDAFNIVGFCRVQVEFNLSIQTWVEYKIGLHENIKTTRIYIF